MKLLISDANILIDMDVGGLIEVMFRLPETFAVPDILYQEELREHHPELPGFGLLVREISQTFVIEAYRLRGQYKGPSQNDLFALALAKQEACRLVTGDKALREVAEAEAVDVRGTLWLIERLRDEDILSLEEIEVAYDRMRREGRRLPWSEVRAQIKRFKKKP